MQYLLVQDSDYLQFPIEPEKKFLALDEVCRRNLNELITHRTDVAADNVLRLQYMNTVASAAEELGVKGIDVSAYSENFEEFMMSVTRVTTRLRLKASSSFHALSVALPRVSKAKILNQIDKLRKLIGESDLTEKDKKKANRELDGLIQTVAANRVDLGRVMATLAFISVAIGGTTSFLADAPEALITISALIGEAKLAEEEELRQIQAEKKPLAIPDMRNEDINDDEIPF